MSVGHDNNLVLRPLAFVVGVTDVLCLVGTAVQEPRFDIINNLVHSLFQLAQLFAENLPLVHSLLESALQPVVLLEVLR